MPTMLGPPRESSSDVLLQKLNALSMSFGDNLKTRVGEVRRIWDLVPEAPSADETRDALVKIQDIVHSLAGSGKSFGFPSISAAAAPLDGLFRLLNEHHQGLTHEERQQVDVLIHTLEDATCVPREIIDLDAITRDETTDDDLASQDAVILVLAVRGVKSAEDIRDNLIGFGRQSIVVCDERDIPDSILRGGPGILYADVSENIQVLGVLDDNLALSRLPLILGSSRCGFEDRLWAVRRGAAVFLAKPFDLADLIEHISSLEENRFERAYRVVIAEDDGPLANFYDLTLTHAGMETRVVNKPSKLLDTLSAFDPDVILMDLYMPECTGLDLAQIVRQFATYTTVPILFMSTDIRFDLQLRARHLGGDDFLPKPLQPGQLISAVTSRAHRYRALKKLTDRDSLTGLLNHANILRCLEREMSVADRAKRPVAFAMIDIDFFKRVNDTYGHAVGDQVITRMTHLIRDRMRRIDYVGRYGGEEFAVVMPNTDLEGAHAVVDQLRLAAMDVVHKAVDGDHFHVTFSAGIACYPTYANAPDVTQAADEALYRAKREGRNRVVVAEPSTR